MDPVDPDPDSDPEHCLESRGNSRLAHFRGSYIAGKQQRLTLNQEKNSRAGSVGGNVPDP